MAIESGTNPPQFYLLARSADVPAEKSARYAGVDARRASSRRRSWTSSGASCCASRVPYERLRHVVREGMHAELVTATQQTIGVMIGSEISEIEADAGCAVPLGRRRAEVTQLDAESGVSLMTLIDERSRGSRAHGKPDRAARDHLRRRRGRSARRARKHDCRPHACLPRLAGLRPQDGPARDPRQRRGEASRRRSTTSRRCSERPAARSCAWRSGCRRAGSA